jgi:hypothetical protein
VVSTLDTDAFWVLVVAVGSLIVIIAVDVWSNHRKPRRRKRKGDGGSATGGSYANRDDTGASSSRGSWFDGWGDGTDGGGDGGGGGD